MFLQQLTHLQLSQYGFRLELKRNGAPRWPREVYGNHVIACNSNFTNSLHLLSSILSARCGQNLTLFMSVGRGVISLVICSALSAPLPLLYIQVHVLNLSPVNYVYYVVGRVLINSCSVHAHLNHCHVSADDCFVVSGKYVAHVCSSEVDMFMCTCRTTC